jgi:DNA mismatch endonuclease (patch repair protein)
MSRVRNRRTSQEENVAAFLRGLKVRYRRNVGSLPGSPDFVVAKIKLAIFVHGCFWHGHANCRRAVLPQTNRRFWRGKIEKNKRRDSSAIRALHRKGWRVLAIWQCGLRDFERVIRRLKRALK